MQKHEHFNIRFDGFILNIFEKRTELFLVWSDFYRHKQNVMKSSSIEDSIFSYRHKNGIFALASSLNIDEKVLAVASVLIYVISASEFVVFYFYFFQTQTQPRMLRSSIPSVLVMRWTCSLWTTGPERYGYSEPLTVSTSPHTSSSSRPQMDTDTSLWRR